MPDGDVGKGDVTGNRGVQGSTSVTATPLSGGIGLWLDPNQLLSPIAMVDMVNDKLATINNLLAKSTADAVLDMVPLMIYSGIFGDTAIESAWAEFHQAWVRETGVTSSAMAELRKLLPDAAEKYEGADLDGGREVSGVDIDTTGSGVFRVNPPPITSPLELDPLDVNKPAVAEPKATMQRL
ncbi:hypothetical protein AB0H00_18445 [Nocardia sp. NPDC023852]|uniref:hypothetical protein n=1 Tax=Nocardia sp. NPDC023852 TaxID=3154697 RepID=UPI0033D57FD9